MPLLEIHCPVSLLSYHLHKDTAQAPGVHCSSVKFGAKKDLWCPVMEYIEFHLTFKIWHTCTRGWPLRGCNSWQEHWRPLPSQSLQAWSHPSSSPTSSVALSPWLWFTVTTSLIKISPVQHSVLVAIADTLQELPQIRFHLEGRHVWCQATHCSYRGCRFEGEVAVGGWLYQDLVTGVTRKLNKASPGLEGVHHHCLPGSSAPCCCRPTTSSNPSTRIANNEGHTIKFYPLGASPQYVHMMDVSMCPEYLEWHIIPLRFTPCPNAQKPDTISSLRQPRPKASLLLGGQALSVQQSPWISS